MDHIYMYKYDGTALVHTAVVPSDIDYLLMGWQVERRKKVRPTPTPIPCTPMHYHTVVDAQYITEEVDCGICGTIRLQWSLMEASMPIGSELQTVAQ